MVKSIVTVAGVSSLAVTPLGFHLANKVADERPIVALFTGIVAITGPVILATRVAYAAGYQAGRASR